MTSIGISFADTPAVDGFGRLRTSEPATIFDTKLLHGKNELVWDEHINDASGSAAATFDMNNVDLTVGANASDRVIRQTKMRFNYLPGKSHLLFMTFCLGNDSGTTKRVGYFNADTTAPYNSDRDGFWIEHDGSDVYLCVAQGGNERRIKQSEWSIDKFMDGPGNNRGVVIDWTKPQILQADMEWLGVGRLRLSFVINGAIMPAHQFLNANDVDGTGLQVPYMDSPNHSLRYEIFSTGGAGTLVEICASVQSEGGYDLVGNLYSAGRGITPFTTGNNTSIYPILSVRLRSDRPDGTVIAQNASLICTTTAQYVWSLRLNPTIVGTDNASWTNVGGNSAVEFDISRDNAGTVTGGTVIAQGYGEDRNQGIGALELGLNSAVRPGLGIDGTADELVLCVQNLANGAESYFTALNWREPL